MANPSNKRSYVTRAGWYKRQWYPLFDQISEGSATPVERFNWHALRHFAISTWIEADLPSKTVQTFAGHSSLQVTMDRYGHLFRSDENAKTMDKIAGDLFAPAGE